MFRFNKKDFASMYSKAEKKATADLEKVNNAYADVINS